MNKRKEICDYLIKNCGDDKKRFVYLGSQQHHSLFRIQPWKNEHVYVEMDDGCDNKIFIGVHGVDLEFNTFSWIYGNEERNVLKNIYQNKVLESIAKRLDLTIMPYNSIWKDRIPLAYLNIKNGDEFTEKEKDLVDKVAEAAKNYHTIINSKSYKKGVWRLVTRTRGFIYNQSKNLAEIIKDENQNL